MAELQEESHCSPKTIAAHLLKKSWGQARGLLEKCFVDRWDQNRTFFFYEKCYVWKKKTLHSNIRNLSHLWNVVVVVTWFGHVLLHLEPGRLAIIDGTKNSEIYQQILKENIRTSVPELSFKRKWAMQKDNDPKHTSHFTKEWLKKNKVNVLEWSGPFV